MVGWQVAGLAGLLVATAAILIPSSLLALVANRLITRYDSLTIVRAIRTGLAPIAVGLLLASGLVLSRGANPTPWAWLIGAAAMAFVLTLKRNPAWALLAAALVGAVAGPFIYPGGGVAAVSSTPVTGPPWGSAPGATRPDRTG